MFKKLFFLATLFFVSFLNAQYTVYQSDFTTTGISDGWILIDNDNNGSGWNLKQSDHYVNMGYGYEEQVLGVYCGGNNNPVGEDWAILPVQDLSYYTGTHLNIHYLQGMFEAWFGGGTLSVYISTSSDLSNIQATTPVATIQIVESGDTPPNEVSVTIDIPEEYNTSVIYIALLYSDGSSEWAIELTQVSITADDLNLSTETNNINTVQLKQNPVKDKLLLQLGSNMAPDSTRIVIYDYSGKLLQQTYYNENGIDVSNLPGGLYIARVTNNQNTKNIKFVKM